MTECDDNEVQGFALREGFLVFFLFVFFDENYFSKCV